MTTPLFVRVSSASLRQMFRPCDPVFIRDVCHARCCESSVEPSGVRIAIQPEEEKHIRLLGGAVVAGRLQPSPVTGKCPFKTSADLCSLHNGQQPIGCVISPFLVTPNGTLVVQNRYRLLKCFRAEGAVPAYRAHFRSLVALFGADAARHLNEHLDAGGGDIALPLATAVR